LQPTPKTAATTTDTRFIAALRTRASPAPQVRAYGGTRTERR
jgi:hypothetical protein